MRRTIPDNAYLAMIENLEEQQADDSAPALSLHFEDGNQCAPFALSLRFGIV